jgi:endonuclease-8
VPEGHTIHRLARDHAAWFTGQTVTVSSPQGRFADGAARLDGRRFETAEAWGKHLFHRYEGALTVHVHLGLFGKVRHQRLGVASEPTDTVRYRVVGSSDLIDLVGPTACELLGPDEADAIVARLGPDPIRTDSDPELAWAALQRRTIDIGRALMDQRVLAGVGNVYRAEVLFVHGLHPLVPARAIEREQWDAIWSTLVSWMRRGVRERRIITVDPAELGIPRRELDRERSTHVYRRDRCLRCDHPVHRFDLGGRWAYACERCQPPPGASGRARARRSAAPARARSAPGARA